MGEHEHYSCPLLRTEEFQLRISFSIFSAVKKTETIFTAVNHADEIIIYVVICVKDVVIALTFAQISGDDIIQR